jgi:hypothetical protein
MLFSDYEFGSEKICSSVSDNEQRLSVRKRSDEKNYLIIINRYNAKTGITNKDKIERHRNVC